MASIRNLHAQRLVPLLILIVSIVSASLLLPRFALASTGNAPSQKQLEELVSPIALYPDTLVAQILAASTHPVDIVEAERFMQEHKGLSGKALAEAVDQQPWDPSVKSLTQFPPVLANMNNNLSWTSSLGDAYYNEPQAVLKEIQVLRKKAQAAGYLKTTPQQTVTQSGPDIVIAPSNPQVIYVPQYNPTVIYGTPMPVYPGYSSSEMMMSTMMGFTTGMMMGSMMSSAWGCDWGSSSVTYNSHTYVTNTNNYYYHNWNNENWNHENPTPNYNSWANTMKNQNWNQDWNNFSKNHPDFEQNHPTLYSQGQQDVDQYRQNNPDAAKQNPETAPATGSTDDSFAQKHPDWQQNMDSFRQNHPDAGDNLGSSQGRWGSGGGLFGGGGGMFRNSGGGGLFGGDRFGSGSFVDSARGRWSSGDFGSRF